MDRIVIVIFDHADLQFIPENIRSGLAAGPAARDFPTHPIRLR
jgi:hypothetical protein